MNTSTVISTLQLTVKSPQVTILWSPPYSWPHIDSFLCLTRSQLRLAAQESARVYSSHHTATLTIRGSPVGLRVALLPRMARWLLSRWGIRIVLYNNYVLIIWVGSAVLCCIRVSKVESFKQFIKIIAFQNRVFSQGNLSEILDPDLRWGTNLMLMIFWRLPTRSRMNLR